MSIIRRSLCRCRSREGSILVITFWALSFLSFFAVTIGFTARQKMVLAERLDQRSRLRMAATAGVQKGVAHLKRLDADPNTDSLKEAWAAADGLGDIKMGDSLVKATIIDEERKININTAGLDVLKGLLKVVLDYPDSDTESIASAIIDWRDEDSFALAQGAEDSYYEGLEHPYNCKDAKFDILDELLLVRGITATIYQDIKDYITAYGSGVVNINTAHRIVLLALGLDEKLVDKVTAFRSGEDELEGTEDDRYFAEAASIASQLGQAIRLEQEESAKLSNLAAAGSIGVVSSNFLISSVAGYEYKKGTARVDCIFERKPLESGDGYEGKIRYWRIIHG